MEHRMQWYDDRLIDQIIDGYKSATVCRVENGVGTDAFNTALHVGQIYQVYDSREQRRVAVRLTAIELVRWGDLPEPLWRRDPAVSGETSEAAFRGDHDDFFEHPDDDFEFLAIYFDRHDVGADEP